MGCDIHFVVEKCIYGKWVGIFSGRPRAGFANERDYTFFAEIASVCGKSASGNTPRFIPTGISDLALAKIIEWGTDGHSHSWMPVKEFSEIALAIKPARFNPHEKPTPWEPLFGNPILLNTDDDRIEDYRIVFWFDN